LDHIEKKQLKPGLKVYIKEKEAFGGSVVLRIDEQDVSIGMQAAEMIKVKRIKENYEHKKL